MEIGEIYRTTKWLTFRVVDKKPKTVVMSVVNTKHQELGIIRWQGTWRQYIYDENSGAMYNDQCLMDISLVLTDLNSAQKKQRKSK